MVLSACSPYFKSLLEVLNYCLLNIVAENLLICSLSRKILLSIPSSSWRMYLLLICKQFSSLCTPAKWMWLKTSFPHSLRQPSDSKWKAWLKCHPSLKKKDKRLTPVLPPSFSLLFFYGCSPFLFSFYFSFPVKGKTTKTTVPPPTSILSASNSEPY